jgi:UDP-N-acetylmuramoylalanine--D-glutamate ligase
MTFAGKRVLLVGLGESGKAAARFFAARRAIVSVNDAGPEEKFQAVAQELRALGVKAVFGGHPGELFLDQELIVPSPGVPWNLPALEAARKQGVPVMGELEIAAGLLKGRVIGITGTNGKTTTTALVGHILASAGWKSCTAGNIGTPVLSIIDASSAGGWSVVELSSFQLEAATTFRTHVGVVLNLTPDHIDRHGSFSAYVAAKARMLAAQQAEDVVVLNAADPPTRELASRARGQVWWFSRTGQTSPGAWVDGAWIVCQGERVVETDLPIRGSHNLENALAAVAAATAAGVPPNQIGEAVRSFRPVEHRLEFVRSLDGVDYYNDSKATNVDATLKAIDAFSGGLWIILGGKDKGGDYTPLAEPLSQRARAALLIGAAAEKIGSQIGGKLETHHLGTIGCALDYARSHAQPGDTVLLAPACASFDQFENYGHRGRVFKQLVAELN